MRIVLASACLILMACPAKRPDVEPSNDGGPAVDAGVPAVDNLALAKTAVTDMCQFMYGCYGESRLMKAFATMGGGLVPSPEDCAEEVTEESEAVAHLAGGLESGRITVDWAAWDVLNPWSAVVSSTEALVGFHVVTWSSVRWPG